MTEADINKMVNQFNDMPPTAAAFDTETTGLHIIYDRPFLFQFGWYVESEGVVYAYTVNLDDNT